LDRFRLNVALKGLEVPTSISSTLEMLHKDVEDLFLASVEPRFACSLVGHREEAE
jgi:hypothetical protein